MPKYPFKARRAKASNKPDPVYNPKPVIKLGTATNPIQISVHHESRREELQTLCVEKGWVCAITVDDQQPEDTSQLDILLAKPEPVRVAPKIDRNANCPCGSGKKYKKCCAITA